MRLSSVSAKNRRINYQGSKGSTRKNRKKRRRKLNVLVIRLNNQGELVNSRPCALCVNILRDYGVKRVYYSTKYGTIACEDLRYIDTTHISIGVRLMVKASKSNLRRLPLTRKQKTQLLLSIR